MRPYVENHHIIPKDTPIEKKTIKNSIQIDSKFRSNYDYTTASNFSISLPSPQKKVVSMNLVCPYIPFSNFAIQEKKGNSKFMILVGSGNLVDGDTYISYLCQLPDGNYTVGSNSEAPNGITTHMQNNLIVNEGSVVYHKDGVSTFNNTSDSFMDLSYNVSQATGRSIFTNNNGSVDYIVHFMVNSDGNIDETMNFKESLGWELGFRKKIYNIENGENLTSEGICYIGGNRTLYISVNDGQKNISNHMIIGYNGTSMDSNILYQLKMNYYFITEGFYSSSNDYRNSECINSGRNYFGPVDIHRLHIKLLDEYGDEVSLNHMDWSFTLIFETMYN